MLKKAAKNNMGNSPLPINIKAPLFIIKKAYHITIIIGMQAYLVNNPINTNKAQKNSAKITKAATILPLIPKSCGMLAAVLLKAINLL